jgi:hypothetical protein
LNCGRRLAKIAVMGRGRHKIATVSRLTGFSPELLRAWELRHHLVCPERGAGGQRLYSDTDLAILSGVRALVDQGRSIGEIAAFGRRGLLDVARGGLPPGPPPAEASRALPNPLPTAQSSSASSRAAQSSSASSRAAQSSSAASRAPQSLSAASRAPQSAPPSLRTAQSTAAASRSAQSAQSASSASAASSRIAQPRWPATATAEPLATRTLQTAARAISRLSVGLAPSELLDGVVDTLADDFQAALARIWVYDPAQELLVLRASAGLSRQTTKSSRARIDLRTYKYKVGAVARTGEPFVSNEIVGDLEFDQRWVRKERLASVAVLPLILDERLYGIQAAFFRVALNDDVLAALRMFAAVAAGALAGTAPGEPRSAVLCA